MKTRTTHYQAFNAKTPKWKVLLIDRDTNSIRELGLFLFESHAIDFIDGYLTRKVLLRGFKEAITIAFN